MLMDGSPSFAAEGRLHGDKPTPPLFQHLFEAALTGVVLTHFA